MEARQLVKRYGALAAVDGVSFQAMRGEVFGFLGANGAGKTTTLRMLCGLLRPTSGTALIDGIDIQADPLAAKARLGYLDEEPFVHPHLTGREFLDFVADLYRMPRGPQREERMSRLLNLFDLAKKDGDRPARNRAESVPRPRRRQPVDSLDQRGEPRNTRDPPAWSRTCSKSLPPAAPRSCFRPTSSRWRKRFAGASPSSTAGE